MVALLSVSRCSARALSLSNSMAFDLQRPNFLCGTCSGASQHFTCPSISILPVLPVFVGSRLTHHSTRTLAIKPPVAGESQTLKSWFVPASESFAKPAPLADILCRATACHAPAQARPACRVTLGHDVGAVSSALRPTYANLAALHQALYFPIVAMPSNLRPRIARWLSHP